MPTIVYRLQPVEEKNNTTLNQSCKATKKHTPRAENYALPTKYEWVQIWPVADDGRPKRPLTAQEDLLSLL